MDYVAIFIFFFAVIDPIGTIPVFIAVTRSYEHRDKKLIAVQAILFSALVLAFFVIAGEVILDAIGVPLTAFQIFGGIVLFLFALTMIFGESKPEEELKAAKSSRQTAIFPLAMPSIASPGAILAAVLLTENARVDLLHQALVYAIVLSVLLVTLLLMLVATRIHGLIGESGASVVSRIMGLLIGSVAVTNMLEGISQYFSL